MAKSKSIPKWLIATGVVLVLAFWVGMQYNSLVNIDENTNYAWDNVETQYERRADLIPNLVATVQGAADFEQDTLIAVTQARTQWQDVSSDPSASLDSQIAAASSFDSALSRLLVTVEAYPNLTATAGFRDFQVQLEGTENRVAVARKDFNEAIKEYNKGVRKLPLAIFAKLFGFELRAGFDATPGSEDAPVVDFS